MNLLKYIFILFALVLAIVGDLIDFINKLLEFVPLVIVAGFLSSIAVKFVDLMIFFFLLFSNIFEDEEKKTVYQQYSFFKKFIIQNRRLIINFLFGTVPENLSFFFGAFLLDALPFRTASIIILILIETGITQKILQTLTKITPLASSLQKLGLEKLTKLTQLKQEKV